MCGTIFVNGENYQWYKQIFFLFMYLFFFGYFFYAELAALNYWKSIESFSSQTSQNQEWRQLIRDNLQKAFSGIIILMEGNNVMI
jgi:hypothetical protein